MQITNAKHSDWTPTADAVSCMVTFPIDEYRLHQDREYTPAVPFQGTGLCFSVSPWARDVPTWMSTWNLRRFGRVGDVFVGIVEKVVPCHHTLPSKIVSFWDLRSSQQSLEEGCRDKPHGSTRRLSRFLCLMSSTILWREEGHFHI